MTATVVTTSAALSKKKNQGDCGHCGALPFLDSPGPILHLLVNLSALDRQSQWFGKAAMAARHFHQPGIKPFSSQPPSILPGNANTTISDCFFAKCQTAIVVWESGHGGAPRSFLVVPACVGRWEDNYIAQTIIRPDSFRFAGEGDFPSFGSSLDIFPRTHGSPSIQCEL